MPSKNLLKLVGAGSIGAAGGVVASELSEPNPAEKAFQQSFEAFKTTFPQLPEDEAKKIHKQVWDKYKVHTSQVHTKALIQGAAASQPKYASLKDLGFNRRSEDV